MNGVRLACLFLACALTMAAAGANAAIYTHRTFLTGSAFLALSPSERVSYATGLVEGVLAAPYLGAPLERASDLNACLQGVSNAHVADMLIDYLGKHARERQFEMPTVTLRALAAACGRK